MLVQIKHKDTEAVIYELDVPFSEPATAIGMTALKIAIKIAVQQAVAENVDLSYASLRHCNLRYANLVNGKFQHADFIHTDLSDTDVSNADFSFANFNGASLVNSKVTNTLFHNANFQNAKACNFLGLPLPFFSQAQSIQALDQVREFILRDEDRLNMDWWHDGPEWKNKTPQEEITCGTSHCLAGWLQVCTTDIGLRQMSPESAGKLIAPQAANQFFSAEYEVLEWLRNREYTKSAYLHAISSISF